MNYEEMFPQALMLRYRQQRDIGTLPIDEPDVIVWVDKKTNYFCVICRSHHTYALCGYVGIPKNHKLRKIPYQRIPEIEVHGGLTFGGKTTVRFHHLMRLLEELVGPKTEAYWSFGFDCAHAGDIMPKLNMPWGLLDATYKDVGYVRDELLSLAKQLYDRK